MFIYNLKLNKNILSKIFFILTFFIAGLLIFYGIYIIFFNVHSHIIVSDNVDSNNVFEITTDNYANILKASNENINSYIGCKVHLIGYVYRLLDFKENQFVIARDMLISKNTTQSLVIGFLCEYNMANDFEDGSWVEATGEITKGNFNGDIALLKIITINKTNKPDELYASPPSDEYIPTAYIF